jgi:hypothetical protein
MAVPAAAIVVLLMGGAAVIVLSGSVAIPSFAGGPVSAEGVRDIPADYLRLYQASARHYGLDWAILAAIGKVECDHGRDPDPSCTAEGATNYAGAGGPAQFLAATWEQYGVDAHGGGRPDRWNPADAIFAMGNYLKASGAPQDYARAIFAYNRATWYVSEVESWASRYRGTSAPVATSSARALRFIAGESAALSPDDGHVALIPAGAPTPVQEMIAAGNELQDLPYGPDGHPDPRGAKSEDCSSTVNFVLYRAGIRPITELLHDNPLAQNYPTWGLPGPGRWVTIYSTTTPTDHVFIVIAGLRLDTSHNGTDIGPNREQDGPRWRILDHLPDWARWAVRHPAGL